MGSIHRTNAGVVSVCYNRAGITDLESQVLQYAVANYSYLVPFGEKLCFAEFGSLIREAYAVKGKTKLCLEAIEKAAIYNRYHCSFEYVNADTGVTERAQATVEVEHWTQVQPALEREYKSQVMSLEMKGASCVYQKGSFTFDAERQEVVL